MKQRRIKLLFKRPIILVLAITSDNTREDRITFDSLNSQQPNTTSPKMKLLVIPSIMPGLVTCHESGDDKTILYNRYKARISNDTSWHQRGQKIHPIR